MTAQLDSAEARPPKAIVGYFAALALTAAATLLAVLIAQLTAIPNLSLVFVLPVVVAAVTYGWGPSALAAVAGALCYNFFFLPPLYSLRIDDPANIWAMVLLLIVAAIVSVVAARSRRQALDARRQADTASALEALANNLAAARSGAAITAAAAEALGRLFHAPAVVLTTGAGGALTLAGKTPDARLSDPDREAAAWVMTSGLATRAQTYPIEAADFDFWPTAKPAGVVGVAFAKDASRPAGAERLVEIVNGYLAVALDRLDHARSA